MQSCNGLGLKKKCWNTSLPHTIKCLHFNKSNKRREEKSPHSLVESRGTGTGLSLVETQREWIFVQWHVCKSGRWEYARALLHPILMMQSEAVEEEIEFSQIEKLS